MHPPTADPRTAITSTAFSSPAAPTNPTPHLDARFAGARLGLPLCAKVPQGLQEAERAPDYALRARCTGRAGWGHNGGKGRKKEEEGRQRKLSNQEGSPATVALVACETGARAQIHSEGVANRGCKMPKGTQRAWCSCTRGSVVEGG
jgi:hypothetical protein